MDDDLISEVVTIWIAALLGGTSVMEKKDGAVFDIWAVKSKARGSRGGGRHVGDTLECGGGGGGGARGLPARRARQLDSGWLAGSFARSRFLLGGV